MGFLEKIKSRYTVKQYDRIATTDMDAIDQLKEILPLSASSNNSQPWRFVFVTNPKVKEGFARVSYPGNDERIRDCSCLIVFQRIDNLKRYEERIAENLPGNFVDDYRNFIKPQGEDYVKEWFSRQVYISLGVLLSACADMGLGTTPMEGIFPEQYDKLLADSDFKTLFAVAVGTPSESDRNHPAVRPKTRLDSEYTIAEI